jgi:hypothetical protein
MTAYAGLGGQAVIGASGVLNELVSWQLQEKGDQVETTAMSNAATSVPKTKIGTLIEWSGQATMNYDPADSDGQELMVANLATALKIYPQGTTTGFRYWSGNIIVSDITTGASVDGKITKTFQFSGTGALTRTTAP